VSVETRRRFVAALDRIAPELQRMGFRLHSIEEQGFATWATYVCSDTKIQFVCAPAGYHIEVFLRVDSKAYELADLMKNHKIREWMQTHEFKMSGDDVLAAEAEWYAMLLRVALSEMRDS
jgi:hypothetical protein